MENHVATDDINVGIIPRCVRWIFNTVNNSPGCTMRMLVSYIEIYNEKLLDLLNNDLPRAVLDIRESSRGKIVVPGLTQIQVETVEQVLEVLWCGAQTRSIATTDMNDYSSRSHTIFQINLRPRLSLPMCSDRRCVSWILQVARNGEVTR